MGESFEISCPANLFLMKNTANVTYDV